jgi:hypothetical protein
VRGKKEPEIYTTYKHHHQSMKQQNSKRIPATPGNEIAQKIFYALQLFF